MKAKSTGLFMLLAALALLAPDRSAAAAEGASSHYLPGMAGDIAIAQSPAPSLQVANTVWVQVGNVNQAVLQGRADVGLDLDVVLDLVGGSYTGTPAADTYEGAFPFTGRIDTVELSLR